MALSPGGKSISSLSPSGARRREKQIAVRTRWVRAVRAAIEADGDWTKLERSREDWKILVSPSGDADHTLEGIPEGVVPVDID